jgi:hypothetical protein
MPRSSESKSKQGNKSGNTANPARKSCKTARKEITGVRRKIIGAGPKKKDFGDGRSLVKS